jgi:hypothetical protein
MTPEEFESRLDALSTANMFAARVVVPFAQRLSRQASMPDSDGLATLLSAAIQEAIPVDVPARWLVVESIRNNLPDILILAREWILLEAAKTVRTTEAGDPPSCPHCQFSDKWNTYRRSCGHCGYGNRR